MKVIAFDQASLTAYSLIDSDNEELLDYGYKDFNKIKDYDERVLNIKKWINEIIQKTKPEAFALEDVQQQVNANTFKKLSELLGVLKNNFCENEYLYLIIAPTQWKSHLKIKGRKRQEQKENTVKFIKQKYGIDVSEDIADSIGIGLYACKELRKIV